MAFIRYVKYSNSLLGGFDGYSINSIKKTFLSRKRRGEREILSVEI